MKVILFVCTANLARSPMAEAIFNGKMVQLGLESRYHAKSAGTWATEDFPAPMDSQFVMRERGLDTSLHRSRTVTQEMIEEVDLVLTMESNHKEALQVEFPDQRNKVFMITEMVGRMNDIHDPFMEGKEEYEKTAQELENLIDQGIDKILALADQHGPSLGE